MKYYLSKTEIEKTGLIEVRSPKSYFMAHNFENIGFIIFEISHQTFEGFKKRP
jgi:hypothetical protein